MTPISRSRTLGALSALALPVLLVGTSACSKRVGGVPGPAGSAMSLLPKETSVVVSLNFDRLRTSKTWDTLVQKFLADPESKTKLDEVVKDCQLDPFKDVSNVLIGVVGNGEHDMAALISSRNLHEDALTACLKKYGPPDVTSTDYAGKKLYEQGGKSDDVLVFLDPQTVLVAGSEAWAKKVIDLKAGKGESVEKNDELVSYVKRAQSDKGVWVAGIVPQSVKEAAEAGGAAATIGKIKGFFGSVDFAGGLAADIEAVTTSAADAKAMADQANTQFDQAKLMLGLYGLASAAQDVKITSSADTMKILVAMSQADLDKAVDAVRKQLGGEGGGIMAPMPPPASEPAAPGAAPSMAPAPVPAPNRMPQTHKK